MSLLHLQTKQQDEQGDAVRVLEYMLTLARDGKVSSVAVAYVRADRVTTSHTWSSSSAVSALIGGVDTMKLQMELEAIGLARPNPDNVS